MTIYCMTILQHFILKVLTGPSIGRRHEGDIRSRMARISEEKPVHVTDLLLKVRSFCSFFAKRAMFQNSEMLTTSRTVTGGRICKLSALYIDLFNLSSLPQLLFVKLLAFLTTAANFGTLRIKMSSAPVVEVASVSLVRVGRNANNPGQAFSTDPCGPRSGNQLQQDLVGYHLVSFFVLFLRGVQ